MTRDLPLDGLRAVSVLFVLLSHAIAWHHLPALARLGGLGVGIFFVISGYIITRVFALDLRMGLAHPIRVFYIKRGFRILPVLLAYLLLINTLHLTGLAVADTQGTLCALLFVRNFSFCPGLPITTHFWSLSVEEQFYLWWPLVFIFASRHGGLNRGVMTFVTASLLLAGISGYTGRWLVPGITRNFPFIAIGVLLALNEVVLRQWLQRHALLAAWLSPLPLILLAGWFEVPYIESAGAFEAGCFLSVPLLSMMVVLLRDRGAMARVLAWQPLVHIGRISFSLYVWQQLFLASDGAVPMLENISVGWRVLLAILVAELSFRWIEQPSLRWRQSLLGSASGSPVVLPESRT